MTNKRLETERLDLEKEKFIVIKKTQTLWNINVAGPHGTAFEGGQFVIQFILDNFPFKPPAVSFKTQVYHPNVSEKGEVCKDMIQTGDKWAPTKRLTKVMEKIVNMLHTPNLDTPLNEAAAADFKNGTWEKKAKECTQKHAK